LRCILSLIAHAIIVMRNWSVAGSIGRHSARSDTQIQAAHLRDFVQEFQRSISGHQAVKTTPHGLKYASFMLRNLARRTRHGLQVKTEPTPWFSLGGAAVFSMALVFVHAHHELWRDEMHCWTLARNAHGFWDILTGVRRYDGHPFLWYYLLHLVSRLSRSVVALHGTTILLATVSAYLWLRDAPLPRFLRIPLLGTYLFFYEYSVLSRSYALGILCLFLFCRAYHRRPLRVPLLSLLLVLLALTSVYGALIAVALAAMLFLQGFVDSLKAKEQGGSRMRISVSVASGIVLFGLGLLLFWTTSVPPKDGFFALPGMMETVPLGPTLPFHYWLANFPRQRQDARIEQLHVTERSVVADEQFRIFRVTLAGAP
jgi:hypothetical protein